LVKFLRANINKFLKQENMDTTNSTPLNEKLLENAKTANKWSSDAVASMMDVYKKQFNIVSGFYSNIFNSLNGENKDALNPAKNLTDLFFNNSAFKSLSTPFSPMGMNGGFSNSFSNPFNNMFNQVKEYNQTMLNNFTKQFGVGSTDANSIVDKYQKTVEKEIDASKNLITSLTDVYNKQVEFSVTESKKLQDEINNQLKQVFEINQKFWSELLNTNANQTNVETTAKKNNSDK
jgi:hypothetical protein